MQTALWAWRLDRRRLCGRRSWPNALTLPLGDGYGCDPRHDRSSPGNGTGRLGTRQECAPVGGVAPKLAEVRMTEEHRGDAGTAARRRGRIDEVDLESLDL